MIYPHIGKKSKNEGPIIPKEVEAIHHRHRAVGSKNNGFLLCPFGPAASAAISKALIGGRVFFDLSNFDEEHEMVREQFETGRELLEVKVTFRSREEEVSVVLLHWILEEEVEGGHKLLLQDLGSVPPKWVVWRERTPQETVGDPLVYLLLEVGHGRLQSPSQLRQPDTGVEVHTLTLDLVDNRVSNLLKMIFGQFVGGSLVENTQHHLQDLCAFRLTDSTSIEILGVGLGGDFEQQLQFTELCYTTIRGGSLLLKVRVVFGDLIVGDLLLALLLAEVVIRGKVYTLD